jgi:hypothetical protein
MTSVPLRIWVAEIIMVRATPPKNPRNLTEKSPGRIRGFFGLALASIA